MDETGDGVEGAALKVPAWDALKRTLARISARARHVDSALSPSFLAPPEPLVLTLAMGLASALIMAVETVQFNMLLLVADYVKATSVISIAMMGLAIGGFLAFALAKARPFVTMSVASVCLFLSLILSYLNIADFAATSFPIYLLLPYVAASLIVSVIFTRTNSTLTYFANLVASGVGAVLPIFLVPVLKSEGTLLLFMLVPILILFLFSLRIRNVVFKAAAAGFFVFVGIRFGGFLSGNLAYPQEIPKDVFETKIVAEMNPGKGEGPRVNFAGDFLKRVYTKDESEDVYRFSSDDYDWRRAKYFLGTLGFSDRFGQAWVSPFERRPYLKDPRAIPAEAFENEVLPAVRKRYSYGFRRDYDLEFLRSAYKLEGERYVLSEDPYARERAKLLLGDLGHFPYLDLALDIRRNGCYDDQLKSFNNNARIVLDEDSVLGRVQLTRAGDRYNMAINGTVLDNIDPYNGNYYDPRVPYLENAKVFIVGLSADGIPKSVKRHPGAQVSGVELNPVIWKTMTDGGFYQTYAADPYKDVAAAKAEARSWLEDTEERFDIITLMNIHQDHGAVSTLGPEYFHTVEATRMMLDRLTDRGMIDYEEIIVGRRAELAFLKMMNTLKAALRASGQEHPELCVYIAKWDFWGGDVFRTVLVKKTPFTKEEVASLGWYYDKVKATGNYSGVAVIYNPLQAGKDPIDAFIRGPDVMKLHELPPQVSARDFANRVVAPAADPRDAEFALRYYPYGGDGKHYLRAAKMSAADKPRLEAIMDKAGYSLAIDLSPTYDDSPFPFNVYAKKTEVTDILKSLAPLALLLAAPLLVILLRSSRTYSVSLVPPVSFAAISGFGYMLVEVVLMQKFQLFVGDPTSALIVIMGGMLVFGGLGSFVSGFLPRKALVVLVALIPLLLGLYAWRLDAWFMALHALRGGARLAAAAGLIFPLTFLMGMPFPNAMEAIKRKTSPDFASLLYGVNGLASTLGSATAFLINVSSGYGRSFLIGTLCYLAAALFFAFFILRSGPKPAVK